jgi:hypothetical protein
MGHEAAWDSSFPSIDEAQVQGLGHTFSSTMTASGVLTLMSFVPSPTSSCAMKPSSCTQRICTFQGRQMHGRKVSLLRCVAPMQCARRSSMLQGCRCAVSGEAWLVRHAASCGAQSPPHLRLPVHCRLVRLHLGERVSSCHLVADLDLPRRDVACVPNTGSGHTPIRCLIAGPKPHSCIACWPFTKHLGFWDVRQAGATPNHADLTP